MSESTSTDPPQLQINTATSTTPSNHTTPPSRFKLIQTTTHLSAIPRTQTQTNDKATTIPILIHATNAFGTWGAGFAQALRTRYPAAEKVYKAWCDEKRPSPDQWPSRELVGRCLVASPQDGDGVSIACLFTSYGYGGRAVRGGRGGGHAAKDGVNKVVESTRVALEELRGWIEMVEEEKEPNGEVVGKEGAESKGGEKEMVKVVVYSPKFNSGNFGVDWEVTADAIRGIFNDWDGEWCILAAKEK